MFGIGIGEIAVILLFATLIFGPKEMAKHAKTIFRFLKKLSTIKDEITHELNSEIKSVEKKEPQSKKR